METLSSITESLQKPDFRKFVEENVKDTYTLLVSFGVDIMALDTFMKSRKFRVLPGEKKKALIGMVQEIDRTVGKFMSGFSSCSGSPELVDLWRRSITSMVHTMEAINSSKHGSGELFRYNHKVAIGLDRYMPQINIENMLLETTESSNRIILQERYRQALFFKKAFPALGELRGFYEIKNFYDESFYELDNLHTQICDTCEGESLALLLIGGLLSFKPMAYDVWDRVKNDLVKIKEFNPAMSNRMWHIITYCCDDLPYFLQQCFLYLACYPIGYGIPATSLTEIWIAEEFITPEEGETIDQTANKYLEQLVQRSLVCVLKRSTFGTIKSCRVHPYIHEFTIMQSKTNHVLAVDPFPEELKSLFRIAIHSDNKKQYTEVKINLIRSFLAFNSDRSFLGSAMSLLKVLELRNSTIPITDLSNMVNLRYLGLRGSTISELPPNIGDMKYLQTLDARDTSIEILPESLWNISKLRRVYVKPSPQIKGPPSVANISDLQVLKTVGTHESWEKIIPQFMSQLRKVAIINRENIDWRSISNLFSHMDKLISMEIMGKIIPSECVDLRAFPNLETVMSIKLDGIWICRKLFIDNVKFPPNLTKLTLTNSGLKEDPMPTLERLQALKFLRLEDGSYIGKQMVCSAGGFPLLLFLKLKKLENLDKWEVDWGCRSKLPTVRVVQCCKLINYPSHLRATITDIDD